MRFVLSFLEGLLQLGELRGIASHRLEIFGFIRIVGGLDLVQGNLLRGIVLGADLGGSLEGKVLEHVRQAARARGVVHVARVHECHIAEDRRLRPLAHQDREPVGQYLGGDPLLEALEILRRRGLPGHCHGHQRHGSLPIPGRKLDLHPCSFIAGRGLTTLHYSRLLCATGGVKRRGFANAGCGRCVRLA